MSTSRKVFKSIKNLNSHQNKKVHLAVNSSRNSIQQEISIQESKASLMQSRNKQAEIRKTTSRKNAQSQKNLPSSSKISQGKGCLKKDKSLRSINLGEQQQCKSTKSIKFNTSYHDVFVYNQAQKNNLKQMKKSLSKKSIRKRKQQADQQCCVIY